MRSTNENHSVDRFDVPDVPNKFYVMGLIVAAILLMVFATQAFGEVALRYAMFIGGFAIMPLPLLIVWDWRRTGLAMLTFAVGAAILAGIYS